MPELLNDGVERRRVNRRRDTETEQRHVALGFVERATESDEAEHGRAGSQREDGGREPRRTSLVPNRTREARCEQPEPHTEGGHRDAQQSPRVRPPAASPTRPTQKQARRVRRGVNRKAQE